VKDKLMALAAVRFGTASIEGQEFLVREIGTMDFARYGELANGKTDEDGKSIVTADKQEATAFLISRCVVDENHASLLTIEEARQLAASARVSMPIVSKVMELSGFQGEKEKKSDAS
jgi:hypothetical protein